MSDVVFMAPPMSRANIEAGTMAIRKLLGFTDPFLDVPRLLEYALGGIAPGFTFEVLDRDVMGSRHGQMDPGKRIVALRLDVYEGLIAGRGRDRFTACHEVGHAVLHGGRLNRLAPGVKPAPYRDPEWQANAFAGALLMPAHMMAVAESIEDAMAEFGVTEDATRVRARVLKREIS
ncbi:MAG: ImmA/IrrE family metallo-endopeptidase [Methylobacterium radiotolerans]